MLTKKMEYGYIILKKLNDNKNNSKILGKEILELSKIPHSMGLQILTQLVKSQIIGSQKGKNGGFYLIKTNITMLDLFLALEMETYFYIEDKLYLDLNYKNIIVNIGECLLEKLKHIVII